MTADEAEKLLVSAYLHEVLYDDQDARDRLCCKRNLKGCRLLIAKGYRDWLKKKQRTSTDERFRMLVNFVLLVNEYRKF